jgi:hypothetical protein
MHSLDFRTLTIAEHPFLKAITGKKECSLDSHKYGISYGD